MGLKRREEEREGRLWDNLCESGIRKLPQLASSYQSFLTDMLFAQGPAQPSGSSQPKMEKVCALSIQGMAMQLRENEPTANICAYMCGYRIYAPKCRYVHERIGKKWPMTISSHQNCKWKTILYKMTLSIGAESFFHEYCRMCLFFSA